MSMDFQNFKWPDAGRAFGRSAYFNGEDYFTQRSQGFGKAWDLYAKLSKEHSGITLDVESILFRACLKTFEGYWGLGFREWDRIPRVTRQNLRWECSELDIDKAPVSRKHLYGFVGDYGELYGINFVEMTISQPEKTDAFELMSAPTPYVNVTSLDVWYFAPPGRFSSGPFLTLKEAEDEMKKYAAAIWGLKNAD
jgi:hypothetical protein